MQRGGTTRPTCLPVLTSLVLAAPCLAAWAEPLPASALTPAPQQATGERLIPLDVSVNNAPAGSWTLMELGGVLHATEQALDEWRIARRPGLAPVAYRGQQWYALSSIPGYQARLNAANQSVDLSFAPAAFSATRISQEANQAAVIDAVEPALFLNFDVSLSSTRARGAATLNELGVLTEIGYASRYGVLTSSQVARNLNAPSPGQPRSVQRLETTFTRNFPQSNLTLRVGDSTTRSGLWSRGIYFGGIQLARNFDLTPGFVTQPLPLLSGTSAAPSTVELYVNDVLRQTSKVPTGPFVIDNFPALTGSGQARLVVRDVLGRETVIVQPFFSSADLLDRGLSDWSLEAGTVRRNLGTESAHYGFGFASGMLRHGLTRDVTLETRAEFSKETQGTGLGATFSLPWQTLGVAALAASRDRIRGNGLQWAAGLEHESARHSFSVHAQAASRRYRQIGLDDSTLPTRLELSASYAYNTAGFGSLGMSLARLRTYDRGTLTTYGLNYTIRVSQRSAVTFNATRVNGENAGTTVGVNLLVPLDGNINATGNFTRRSGKTDAYAGANQGLAGETGLGWRALAGVRENTPFSEGGVFYQGDKLLVTADASASSQQQTLRLGAQGALVFIGGGFFASRRVDNSFALVEVPGYAGVGVGFQGNALTRTDTNGRALLPRLVPYQRNHIRLDAAELPINAELDSIELTAVPALRSAVRVTFPVRSGRGALLRIVLEDGEPAPAGAEVAIEGDAREFFVARRGESFVTGLKDSNTLSLKWNGATCSFTVKLPPGKLDDIARVGPLQCLGVKR